MPINASLQRRLDSMKAEAQKIRDAHKMSQSAASDKVQKDIELINSKRQQMLDAEKKRMQTQQNRTDEMRDFTAEVELMVTIKEKYASGGFDYETEINDKLKKHGKTDPDAKTAGSSGDAPDAKFSHNGEDHFLEVKKDKNAMYGQIELKHDGQKWHISDKSKAKYPETAKSIEATGFLHKVNKQWGKPSGDYEKDLQLGNVYHTHPDAEPIKAHYGKDRKTNYMQIGGGHGFYHTGEDKAGLGSPELDGKTQLRARMKARGRDAEGKRTYGALIVMGLKEPSKSHHNLDVAVQKEWIEDILMGHKEFKLNEATESAFSIGFRNGQEERIKQNPYTEGTEEYTKYESGFYQGVIQRRVMQEQAPVAPVPDKKYIKGTDEYKAHKATKKPINGHPTNKVKEDLDEAKIGDKVEITGGSAKGVRGTVGEIRHGLYKGAPKTITVYHGEKDATQVKQHLIKRVAEETELDEGHVEFRIDHRDKLTGDHKATFASHGAKVSDTTDKATYVKVPSDKADSFKKAMKGHGSSVELAESDAAWAASMEKKKEDKLTNKDKNTLSKLRAMMAKEKKPVNEESSAYEKSEENKRSADAAKKQGDMFAHHLHMANYHDNLSQWHSEKGRHSVADEHAKKSEEHHDQAMKLKEEVAANNVGGGAIAGTQGDAGKKVVMTKEPLKRKPIPKFKNYVSQEHDGY